VRRLKVATSHHGLTMTDRLASDSALGGGDGRPAAGLAVVAMLFGAMSGRCC